ncbi:GntR family transcriptional regulator [Bosea sp. RAF48]|uniref:GntR family transcriptional regulator n=1 Tax=Bosea sp. RAF48 TaxID=3237480 RepID=UPI003F8F9011
MLAKTDAKTEGKISLADRVYEELRAAIVLGEIAQGSVFNESDLVSRFKVSTSPLREALSRLRQDGLVRVIPRRGYSVTELTLRDFHELIQMRLILECSAAELAAPRIADSHVETMRRLSSVELEVGNQASYRAFMRANQEFHEGIAQIADNSRLSRAIGQTMDEMQRLLFADLGAVEDGDEVRHDHDEIIDALARRDAAAARDAVARHVKVSRDRVVGRMMRRHSGFADKPVFSA